MKSTSVWLMAVLAVASFLVAGCEQVYATTGEAAIRRDGDTLLIGTCGQLDIEAITVSGRYGEIDFLSRTERFVTLYGHAEFDDGNIYRVGQSVDGMDVLDTMPVDFQGLSKIHVAVSSRVPPHNPLFQVWDVHSSGIPETGWLSPDGTVTNQPCG